MRKGTALLAATLAGILMLGLQTPAHASPVASRPGLAVANTATFSSATAGASTPLAAVTVTVASGDTLSGLAARHCSNSAWQQIYQDNTSVVGGNPNLIYPGQRLVINCATGTTTAAAPAAAPQPQAAPASSSGWVHPAPALCFPGGNSGFRTGARPGHNGIDLPGGGGGQVIRAAAAGTVSVGWQAGGAGNYTTINHGGGVWTVYMHQSSFAVRSGYVAAGQVIGYVGSTGDSSGPHLHLEVHTGGLWSGMTNPVTFFANRGVNLYC